MDITPWPASTNRTPSRTPWRIVACLNASFIAKPLDKTVCGESVDLVLHTPKEEHIRIWPWFKTNGTILG